MKFLKNEIILGDVSEDNNGSIYVDDDMIEELENSIFQAIAFKAIKKDKELAKTLKKIIKVHIKKIILAKDVYLDYTNVGEAAMLGLKQAIARIQEDFDIVFNVSDIYLRKDSEDDDKTQYAIDVVLGRLKSELPDNVDDIDTKTLIVGKVYESKSHQNFIYSKEDIDCLYGEIAKLITDTISVEMSKKEYKQARADIFKKVKKTVKNIGQGEMIIKEKTIVASDRVMDTIEAIFKEVKKKMGHELYLDVLFKYVEDDQVRIDFAVLLNKDNIKAADKFEEKNGKSTKACKDKKDKKSKEDKKKKSKLSKKDKSEKKSKDGKKDKKKKDKKNPLTSKPSKPFLSFDR